MRYFELFERDGFNERRSWIAFSVEFSIILICRHVPGARPCPGGERRV